MWAFRRYQSQAQAIFFRLSRLLSSMYGLKSYCGLGQRGRCCFCAACPNRKMYLEIRKAYEGLFRSRYLAIEEAATVGAGKIDHWPWIPVPEYP